MQIGSDPRSDEVVGVVTGGESGRGVRAGVRARAHRPARLRSRLLLRSASGRLPGGGQLAARKAS